MPAICLTFRFHQPRLLRRFSFFSIGESATYEDEPRNRERTERAADAWYLPAIALLDRLTEQHAGRFRYAVACSGVFLDLCRRYRPDVMDGLARLNQTGCAEWLLETSHHSLASIQSPQEFLAQAGLQAAALREIAGTTPAALLNTGLIYHDTLAGAAENLGLAIILAGSGKLLKRRQSPARVYAPAAHSALRIVPTVEPDCSGPLPGLPKRLSRDSLVSWLFTINPDAGGLAPPESVLRRLEQLPALLLGSGLVTIESLRGAVAASKPAGVLGAADPVSGIPPHYDLTPWMGGEMQGDAFEAVYQAEPKARACADARLLATWRMLQEADHFALMGSPLEACGTRHPYGSPYDAYINFMNILTDFNERL